MPHPVVSKQCQTAAVLLFYCFLLFISDYQDYVDYALDEGISIFGRDKVSFVTYYCWSISVGKGQEYIL